MNLEEKQYLEIMRKIIDIGDKRNDRTKVGTKAIFGTQMRFDLSKTFPLLTTKRVWFKGVIHELIWILSGSTNIKYLKDNNVHIWDEWADKNGDLGPVYGEMWRKWPSNITKEYIDQISHVMDSLKNDPYGRRHVVSAWNPSLLSKQALPPCHCLFQFFISDGKLSCQMYARSQDWFLGTAFNIAFYSLLVIMMAQILGLKPGTYIHTTGDTHLYDNHIEQANLQLSREPRNFPKVKLNPNITNLFNFKYEDIELLDYNPHQTIKAKVAI